MKRVQNQAVMVQKTTKNSLVCEIDWNGHSDAEWARHFAALRRSNMLQSVPYANAMRRLKQQRARRGLIYINGQAAGLVQILEAGIFGNAIHALVVDRGPLWFDGRGGEEDMRAFLTCFTGVFPKRFGRKIRFIPEANNTAPMRALLRSYGFSPVTETGYQTIWLDLRHDEEVLRKGLKKKWRNTLRKAEKQNMSVHFAPGGQDFGWLLDHYMRDKQARGYDGVSAKTLMALAAEFSRGQNMVIGSASLDGQVIAAILLFIHGTSATYQIGYTSAVGREKCAHHLLLWKALAALKDRKIYDFDLGGINDHDAKGVKQFKQGMGGDLVETIGLCR